MNTKIGSLSLLRRTGIRVFRRVVGVSCVTCFLLLSSSLLADDTQKHVVTGGIYPLMDSRITSTDKHKLVDVTAAKMKVGDAQELISNILKDASSQPGAGTFNFDTSTTYIINIMKFQDDTHTVASDQNWYAYNEQDLSHFGSFTFKSKQNLFEGARLYGRTKVCLIGIFLNEDGAQTPYVTPNVVYNITETKQQIQLVNDLQSLLSIVFGGAGTNQVGFYFVANQTLSFNSSTVAIEGLSAPLLTATSKQYATPDATGVVGVVGGTPNLLQLRIANKNFPITLLPANNTLDGLKRAIAASQTIPKTVSTTIQPDQSGKPSTLTMSVQGRSGATSFSLTEIAPTLDQEPILKATVKQTSLGKQAFQNQAGSWITLGISVPLNSYSDVSYQSSTSTSGPSLQPTNVTRQNVYASVGFYYPTVDPLQTRFRWIPHPLVGVPFTTNPLKKSMAGLAIGLNWAEPFAAVLFNVAQIHPKNASSPTALENHLVFKGVFGINIPLSTAVKLLASKSSSSTKSTSSTASATTQQAGGSSQ